MVIELINSDLQPAHRQVESKSGNLNWKQTGLRVESLVWWDVRSRVESQIGRQIESQVKLHLLNHGHYD
jgi:hypothetical protein